MKKRNEIKNNPNLGFDDYVNGLTCTAGDPVNVSNGNFITGEVDLTFEGDVSIKFMRYYNSLDDYDGVLGRNWRSNYQVELQKLSDRRYRLCHEDGHSEDFVYGDDQIWYGTPGTNSNIDVKNNSIIITLFDKTIYTFDENQKLISVKEPYSQEIIFDYNEDDNLSKVTQGNFSVFYTYEGGKLTKVSDHSGRVILLGYEENNLSEVKKYDGTVTIYEYDDNGFMTKMHINGYTIINEYDENNNKTAIIDAEGNRFEYTYDADNYMLYHVEVSMRIAYNK